MSSSKINLAYNHGCVDCYRPFGSCLQHLTSNLVALLIDKVVPSRTNSVTVTDVNTDLAEVDRNQLVRLLLVYP